MRIAALCTIFIILLKFQAKSQRIEKLYDINWKETVAANARYASEIVSTDSGWFRRDYYLPKNSLQMQGLYKDSECKIENGWFYYIYPDGKLESKGRYVNKKREGLWIRYHTNGFLKDSTVYNDDKPIGTSIQWHNTGYISDSATYTANGGVRVSWHDDGTISSAGRFNNADQGIGKWKYFHRNGNISSEELYDNGKLIQILQFTEEGKPVTDTTGKNYAPALFKGGIEAWTKYLGKKLYWPNGYQLANTDKVAIGVQFRVDETGTIKDIFVFAPFTNVFDDIIIRALQQSPKWIPAISHNRKVSYFHRQTVNFTQETD